jgi:alkanesulfonate monooxygenase SsuD/methylene tetrahydromethanopterin reductase-like flavin-dependent oxidoreductase (luciferase family)
MNASTKTAKILSSRSRVDLWWSTAPRHVGYAAPHERNDLGEGAPNFHGTPGQVLAEILKVRRNVGQGTFLAFRFHHDGREVTRQDLDDVVSEVVR